MGLGVGLGSLVCSGLSMAACARRCCTCARRVLWYSLRVGLGNRYHNLQDADKQTQPWQDHYAEHEVGGAARVQMIKSQRTGKQRACKSLFSSATHDQPLHVLRIRCTVYGVGWGGGLGKVAIP